MKYYRTVQEARRALALDTGFDPFTTGHMGGGQPTKAKLADLGYVVDPGKVAAIERAHHCQTCQKPVEQEFDGMDFHWPTHCREHRAWEFKCDNGHRWKATTEQDKANDHKCSVCGEYWV